MAMPRVFWTAEQQQAGVLPRGVTFPTVAAWEAERRHLGWGVAQDVAIGMANVAMLVAWLEFPQAVIHTLWGDAGTPGWAPWIFTIVAYLNLMRLWRSWSLMLNGLHLLHVLSRCDAQTLLTQVERWRTTAPGLLRTLDAWLQPGQVPLLVADVDQLNRNEARLLHHFYLDARIHTRQTVPFGPEDAQRLNGRLPKSDEAPQTP